MEHTIIAPKQLVAVAVIALIQAFMFGCKEQPKKHSNPNGGTRWGSFDQLSSSPNLSEAANRALSGDMRSQRFLVSLLDQWMGDKAAAALRGDQPYVPRLHAEIYNTFFKHLVRAWSEALPLAIEWTIPEKGIRNVAWNPKLSDEALVIATSGKSYLCKTKHCRQLDITGVQQAVYRNDDEIILSANGGIYSYLADRVTAQDNQQLIVEASDAVDLQVVADGDYLVVKKAGLSFSLINLNQYSEAVEFNVSYPVVGFNWDKRYPDWLLVTTSHRIEVIHLQEKTILQSIQQIPFDSKFTQASFFPNSQVEAIVTMANGGSHGKLETWDFSGDRLHMRIVDPSSQLTYVPDAQSLFLYQPDQRKVERLFAADLRSITTVKLRPTDEVFSISGQALRPNLVSAGTYMPVLVRDLNSGLVKAESMGGLFYALEQGNPKHVELNPFDDSTMISVHKRSMMIWSQNLAKRSIYEFPTPIDGSVSRHPMNPHVLLFKSVSDQSGQARIFVLNFLASAQYSIDYSSSSKF